MRQEEDRDLGRGLQAMRMRGLDTRGELRRLGTR